jgi:hypothetical protein
MAVVWKPQAFMRHVESDLDKSTRRAALMVAKEAARGMRAAKTGKPGPIQRRSAPGEPPAVQTKRLIGSIKTEKLRDACYRVGSPEKIGYWLEFGTRPYTIKPKKAPYLRFQTSDGNWVTTSEVHHPGIAARPWLRPAMLKTKALFKGKGIWKGPVAPK